MSHDENTDPGVENTPGRAAELQIEELGEQLRRAQSRQSALEELVECMPGVVWESWGKEEPADFRANFVSPGVTEMTGYTMAEWLSKPAFWRDLMPPEDLDQVDREIRPVLAAGAGLVQYRWRTKDGRMLWVETHMRVIHDDAGQPIGVRGVTVDITARKEKDEAQAELLLQREIIRAQEASLAQLSAPLLPISDDVLVMPLIGDIDDTRAARMLDSLLQGLAAIHARVVIIDITGVPEVDADVADALVRAARAVRLLGVAVILTGIRPEVARTLVALGQDLEGIATHGTLQRGVAAAMRRLPAPGAFKGT